MTRIPEAGSKGRTLLPRPTAHTSLLELPQPEASRSTVFILARSYLDKKGQVDEPGVQTYERLSTLRRKPKKRNDPPVEQDNSQG